MGILWACRGERTDDIARFTSLSRLPHDLEGHAPEGEALCHAHSRCKAPALQTRRPPWAGSAAAQIARTCARSAHNGRLGLADGQLLRQYALVHALQIMHGQDGLVCALLILQREDPDISSPTSGVWTW